MLFQNSEWSGQIYDIICSLFLDVKLAFLLHALLACETATVAYCLVTIVSQFEGKAAQFAQNYVINGCSQWLL